MAGLIGCANHSYNQMSGRELENDRPASGDDALSHQRIADSRTAARVREALAADADYKYDAVSVTAAAGLVHLTGLVNTKAQRSRAAAVARRVAGVMTVQNGLTVNN
jgi:osmotically-inducible protein OsmY